MSKFFGAFGRNGGPVNITRDCYTMASVNGDEAEIEMYGEIMEERPVDWRTGEPIEGGFIVLDEFLDDLKSIEGVKRLTIRLNSTGGSAYAAIPIHNRLRELKAAVTVIVDGAAMSGGSLIMCAADTVRVNPSSLIMIHKCWGFVFGGYNANELRNMATRADAVDKAQAAIYKRKTGIDEETLLSMMADTTYMTGKEAAEKGFADELTEDDAPDIAASADLGTLYVNGRAMKLSAPLMNLPENIRTIDPSAEEEINKPTPDKAANDDQKGGKKIMAKTLEELRKESPELAEEIMTEALAAAAAGIADTGETERKRIKEIDEISALFDPETVKDAKYGENPCTAQEMAYRAALAEAKQGGRFMRDMQEDASGSGAQGVNADPATGDDDKPLTSEQRTALGRSDAKKILNKEGE